MEGEFGYVTGDARAGGRVAQLPCLFESWRGVHWFRHMAAHNCSGGPHAVPLDAAKAAHGRGGRAGWAGGAGGCIRAVGAPQPSRVPAGGCCWCCALERLANLAGARV